MHSLSHISSSLVHTGITYKDKIVPGVYIRVSSILDIPRDSAWNELQKGSLLRYISDGKNRFGELPETWKQGEHVQTKVETTLGEVLPLSKWVPYISRFPLRNKHNILFTDIDNSKFTASTQESNPTIKLWNHDMCMQEVGDGKTHYTDAITLYAGGITVILGRYTEELYKYRHQRWQEVCKILNTGKSTDSPEYDVEPLKLT